MEIRDAARNLVRSYSSVKDSTFKSYDGGYTAEPVMTKTKGLNRFVWNMRYRSVQGVYIEVATVDIKLVLESIQQR